MNTEVEESLEERKARAGRENDRRRAEEAELMEKTERSKL
jgi:hypothetical protein